MKISHAQTKTYKPIAIELETEHEAHTLRTCTGKISHSDMLQNNFSKEEIDVICTIFREIDRLLKDNT